MVDMAYHVRGRTDGEDSFDDIYVVLSKAYPGFSFFWETSIRWSNTGALIICLSHAICSSYVYYFVIFFLRGIL